MITKEECLPGAILTVNKQGFPLFKDGEGFGFAPGWSCANGTQLEVIHPPKKVSGVNVIKLKMVGTENIGYTYWTFAKGECILTTPSLKEYNDGVVYSAKDLNLNIGEELILVNKNNPKKIVADLNHNSGGFGGHKPPEDTTHFFTYTEKSSQRRGYKSVPAFNGFLSNAMVMICAAKWPKDLYLNKEIFYHLQGMSMPHYLQPAFGNPIEDWKDVEVRKYSKETKKITTEAVDFDCYFYMKKLFQTFTQTYHFGPGISQVANEVVEGGCTHPFIFSAKADVNKSNYPSTEKDIYLDLALKDLGWKKKDYPNYNQNSFIAIAFKSEEEREEFSKAYKNSEKVIHKLHIDDILNHPEIISLNKSSSIKL